MRILRKGKELLEIFRCKLGYHEWVAVHWTEFKQRPRRAIFSKKGGRRKAQYYEKRYVKYYCMSIILVNPGRFLKRNLGFLIQLLLVL